jgi:hypothetical protein
VAAAALAHAAPNEMTATRVVGTLGRDDQESFEALMARIGDEYDLDWRFEIHGASFSARFSRC